MSNNTKQIIMLLATFAVSSLVAVTWALIKVSDWIVFHDPVWDQMDKEGAVTEHNIAEVFRGAGSVYITAVEVIIGLVFLILLRRALFANSSNAIQENIEKK